MDFHRNYSSPELWQITPQYCMYATCVVFFSGQSLTRCTLELWSIFFVRETVLCYTPALAGGIPGSTLPFPAGHLRAAVMPST